MPGCVNLYQNRGLESGSLSGSHLDQLMGLVGGGAKGMYEAMITNAIGKYNKVPHYLSQFTNSSISRVHAVWIYLGWWLSGGADYEGRYEH